MTGVWDTAGGTFWNGAGGETEDTATACCAPFKRQSENTLQCIDGYKCQQDIGNKVILVPLDCALMALAKGCQPRATGRAQRTQCDLLSGVTQGSTKKWEITDLNPCIMSFRPATCKQNTSSSAHGVCCSGTAFTPLALSELPHAQQKSRSSRRRKGGRRLFGTAAALHRLHLGVVSPCMANSNNRSPTASWTPKSPKHFRFATSYTTKETELEIEPKSPDGQANCPYATPALLKNCLLV